MDDILHTLQVVHRKVSQLESKLIRLQEEQRKAETVIKQLEQQIKEKDQSLETLRQQYEAAKLVGGLDTGGDREALQAKIDLYLQEIDVCLKSFGE